MPTNAERRCSCYFSCYALPYLFFYASYRTPRLHNEWQQSACGDRCVTCFFLFKRWQQGIEGSRHLTRRGREQNSRLVEEEIKGIDKWSLVWYYCCAPGCTIESEGDSANWDKIMMSWFVIGHWLSPTSLPRVCACSSPWARRFGVRFSSVVSALYNPSFSLCILRFPHAVRRVVCLAQPIRELKIIELQKFGQGIVITAV